MLIKITLTVLKRCDIQSAIMLVVLGSPSDTFLLAGAAVSWKGVKQTSIMEVKYMPLQPTLRHLIRGLDLRTLDC